MIKKYIKFELRSTWKLNALFVGIPAILTFLFCITISFSLAAGGLENDPNDLTVRLLLIPVYMLKELLLWGIIIYFIIRYCKTMHGEERFFTYMLPMTRKQLFIGKWLSLSIWLFLSFATVFIDYGFLCLDNIWNYFRGFVHTDFSTMFSIFLTIILVAVLLSLYIAFHCTSILNISPLLGMGTVPGAIITCIVVSFARYCLYFVFSTIIFIPMGFLLGSEGNGGSFMLIIIIFMIAGIIGAIVTELTIIITFTQLNKRAFKKNALNLIERKKHE